MRWLGQVLAIETLISFFFKYLFDSLFRNKFLRNKKRLHFYIYLNIFEIQEIDLDRHPTESRVQYKKLLH